MTTSDIKKLAEIIKANPGAIAMIDNDNWQLEKQQPPDFDEWPEARQNKWYDNEEGTITDNHHFSLPISHGFGLLLALAHLAGIEVEQP